MFATVTAFCRSSAAALHVRPSAVHCELQLSPYGAFVHFITSCIVVCAFAVPAHHVTARRANAVLRLPPLIVMMRQRRDIYVPLV